MMCAFFTGVLAAGVCLAGAGDLKKGGGQAPVVVTARSLFADNKKKLVVYKKDVVVTKGDITLYADEVVIHLVGTGKEGGPGTAEVFKGSGKIDRIEARGGVRVIQGDKTATSDEAVYYNDADKIVLTGSPRVWQGGNVLSGSKITYAVKEDTFLVDDAKTVLYPEDKVKGPGPEAGGVQ